MTTEWSPLVLPSGESNSKGDVLVPRSFPSSSKVAADTRRVTKGRSWSFRTLGLVGGVAMLVSNGLVVRDRAMAYDVSGFVIACYGVAFGLLVLWLELPNGWCSDSGSFHNGGAGYYFRFLDFTAGRGAFFVFCGILQASNLQVWDVAVGGFLVFVGLVAIMAGTAAARDLQLFKQSLAREEDLQVKWAKFDVDGNSTLDVKELTTFVKKSGIGVSREEIARIFVALDKDFDEKISYDEFQAWWMAVDS